MARLFVAVWPPAPVIEALAALPRPDTPGLRWTGPAQWHVTLRFFGEAEPADAMAACAAVAAAPAEAVVGPAVERLGRGVVVVPVEGLDALAAAVVTATAGVGRPPEDRPFRGHLTLARTKGRVRTPLIGETVSGRWTVDSIELVRSDTHADGSRYTIVERFPLLA